MVGLVQFQHHVVADVDDVVDRAHAGGGQASRHPLRRGGDLHAGDHGRGEARTPVRCGDLDRGDPLGADDDEFWLRRAEGRSELGREVAGHADVPPAVRAIARDVGVDQHVGGETERVAVRNPERCTDGEDVDPRVVVADAELGRRAEHPFRVDAEDAAPLDRPSVGHGRAERGHRDDVTRLHVERPAPDVALDAVAGVDVDALHLRRVGVLFEADHAGGQDACDRATDLGDRVDLESERRQRVGDALHGDRVGRIPEVPVFVEPGQ